MVDLGGVSDVANVAVGGGLGGIFIGEGIRWIRRRWSRDRVDSVRDRAEENFITRLVKERDDAMTRADLAFKERNEAIQREAQAMSSVGELKAQIASLRETVERLEKELRRYINGHSSSGAS